MSDATDRLAQLHCDHGLWISPTRVTTSVSAPPAPGESPARVLSSGPMLSVTPMVWERNAVPSAGRPVWR
jgi:hypothetical protein